MQLFVLLETTKKPYSSCKSMEIDSINEEYGPVIPKVQSNEPSMSQFLTKESFKKAQIQYHLDKLKELTQ